MSSFLHRMATRAQGGGPRLGPQVDPVFSPGAPSPVVEDPAALDPLGPGLESMPGLAVPPAPRPRAASSPLSASPAPRAVQPSLSRVAPDRAIPELAPIPSRPPQREPAPDRDRAAPTAPLAPPRSATSLAVTAPSAPPPLPARSSRSAAPNHAIPNTERASRPPEAQPRSPALPAGEPPRPAAAPARKVQVSTPNLASPWQLPPARATAQTSPAQVAPAAPAPERAPSDLPSRATPSLARPEPAPTRPAAPGAPAENGLLDRPSRAAPVATPSPRPAQPPRASEPDIHITIGSVEVRGKAPAPRPAPPRPRAPTLSLADYLAGRRGGRS